MKPDRAEREARKAVTIIPPENGWWGVHFMGRTLLHQSEESAVIEREAYVEWIVMLLRREQQRAYQQVLDFITDEIMAERNCRAQTIACYLTTKLAALRKGTR